MYNSTTNKPKEIAAKINQSYASAISNCNIGEAIDMTSERQQAQLARYKQDTHLKNILAIFVIFFTVLWSVCILILMFLTSNNANHFNALSDSVLIALITETLCLVLGLPLIVITHFFPKDNKETPTKENKYCNMDKN